MTGTKYTKVKRHLRPEMPTAKVRILEFLRSDYEVHPPKDICAAVGVKYSYTITLIHELVNEGKVLYPARGKYQAKRRRIVRRKKSSSVKKSK